MKFASDLWEEYLHKVLLRPLTRESWQAFVAMWRGTLNDAAKRIVEESVEIEFCDYPLNGCEGSPEEIALSYLKGWVKDDDEKIAFLAGNRPSEIISEIGGCFVKKNRDGCGGDIDAASGLFFLDNGFQVRRRDGVVERFQTLYDMVVFGGWSAD